VGPPTLQSHAERRVTMGEGDQPGSLKFIPWALISNTHVIGTP